MIDGYPGRASVHPGERLVVHVATTAPRFRVTFHRWHARLEPAGASSWLPGRDAARGSADADWGWPGYEIEIPKDWRSGVYVARFEEPGASGAVDPAMSRSACLFVVRGSGRAPLLYKLPLATYHAYNFTGGGCFYVNPPRSASPPGSKVTLHRPGGGIGGEVWGALDHYDSSSPRQTFAHWDAPFIRWLVCCGYEAEFCTDFDIHHDPKLLHRYRLLVSVGHDEYWSEQTRDAVESFVDGGGRVAFFGANVCWWRIHVVDAGTAIVCHQGGPQGAFDHWWPKSGANRPEDSLTGVSYRHGGGWWDGPRRTRGYTVQRADHWIFEGTGLCTGDRFGEDTVPPLVGYECDGAPFDSLDPRTGLAELAADSERYGTPRGFVPLAVAPLDEHWQELPPREAYAGGGGIHTATMGIYERDGIVFTAGTTDWAQVLTGPTPGPVERITHNVLARLSAD